MEENGYSPESAPVIIYFEVAIFINYLCTGQTNPPFQNLSAVI